VEGGAKMFVVFRVKNHDFTPKNLIFSNFREGAHGPAPPLDPPLEGIPLPDLEKPKYTVISLRNTLVKAEIHLENAEIHLNIFQMNLQWIENDEINLKKINGSLKRNKIIDLLWIFLSVHPKRSKNLNTRCR
jgi:hypothetical protein